MDSQSSLSAVDTAIRKVLNVRQHVEELRETLSQPGKQQTAQTRTILQALATVISNLSETWPAGIAPALQQVHAQHVKPDGTQQPQDLRHEGTQSQPGVSAASTNKTPQERQAQRIAGLVQQLDSALAEQLPVPVRHSQHARKRPHAGVTSTTNEAPGIELQSIVSRVKAACPMMQVHLASQTGSLATLPKDAQEVRLHVPNVFIASVALRSPGAACAVRVAFDSADKLQEGIAWGTSQHHVYKRMSALALRALAYFTHRAAATVELEGLTSTHQTAGHQQDMSIPASTTALTPFPGIGLSNTPFITATPPPPVWIEATTPLPDNQLVKQEATDNNRQSTNKPGPVSAVTTAEGIALEDLLLWISNYRDVFTRPCCESGHLMSLEPPMQQPLPPILRPFKLTREQLLHVAINNDAIQAYHTHTAPKHLLGWDQQD